MALALNNLYAINPNKHVLTIQIRVNLCVMAMKDYLAPIGTP